MLQVLAKSKKVGERTNVRYQLSQARKELAAMPGKPEGLDDSIAEEFNAEHNLGFEFERICRLGADGRFSEMACALARIEELLTATQAATLQQKMVAAVKWLIQARSDLPADVLLKLEQVLDTESFASPEYADPSRFDLAHFAQALKGMGMEAEILKNSVSVRDVADLAIEAGGGVPERSELVQRKFSQFAGLIRESFENAQATFADGLAGRSTTRELQQMLRLNGVLTRVQLSDQMDEDIRRDIEDFRDHLLTPQEQEWVRDRLSVLNPSAEALERANGQGSISYDLGDIRQYRPNARGDACVQAVLRHHRRPHQNFGTNDRFVWRGLEVGRMREQLKAQGIGTLYLMPASFRQACAQDLRLWLAHHGPLLASSEDHAVVITRIEGDIVTIHCPLLGTRRAPLDELNKYLDWTAIPSPIMATYQAGPATAKWVLQPEPGKMSRLATRLFVAKPEKNATPSWEDEASISR